MSENFKDQTKHGHIWNYSERAAARNLGKAVERAGAGQGWGGMVTFAFTNRRTYVWITCFSTLYLVLPPSHSFSVLTDALSSRSLLASLCRHVSITTRSVNIASFCSKEIPEVVEIAPSSLPTQWQT